MQLHVLGTWSCGCLELGLCLNCCVSELSTSVSFVAERAMLLLDDVILVLWLGLLVWCVVVLHLIYFEVKRKRTNAVQGIEKDINTIESPAPSKLFRRPTRHKGCQKKGWLKISSLMAVTWRLFGKKALLSGLADNTEVQKTTPPRNFLSLWSPEANVPSDWKPVTNV